MAPDVAILRQSMLGVSEMQGLEKCSPQTQRHNSLVLFALQFQS